MEPTPDAVIAQAVNGYENEFGAPPEIVGCAPGRVNLIGEHTDYSGGFVLPAAIPYYTAVAVGRGMGELSRFCSSSFGTESRPVSPLERRGGFADYLAGAARAAGLEGHALRVFVHGNLPVEAGLSSSASLLVAAAAAFGEMSGRPLPARELAFRAKAIENDFIGLPCGLMDQYAVACAQEDQALLLDCTSNRSVPVSARLPGCRWVVVYSGIRRELTGGGYKARVVALKEALTCAGTGAADLLREGSETDVERLGRKSGLNQSHIALMRHVCCENQRVHNMRHALESGSADRAGRLLYLGHRSLSQLFGVSTPALDGFVEHAKGVPGVLGMRLTGAGMGGSLVALMEKESVPTACRELTRHLHAEVSMDGRLFPIDRFARGAATWKP
jgi:galactokinase